MISIGMLNELIGPGFYTLNYVEKKDPQEFQNSYMFNRGVFSKFGILKPKWSLIHITLSLYQNKEIVLSTSKLLDSNFQHFSVLYLDNSQGKFPQKL